jgi:regulator of protease activity HflC (stomatin/prohibitin superfamily)
MESLGLGAACLFVFLFIVLVLAISAIKIVPEYERGVIFRLGRLIGARGPGLFFVIPIMERMIRVDQRVITADVPAQEVITRDNVTIKVNAVLYFKVLDPNQAVTQVMDYVRATMQISQTTLRSVVGQFELDALLAQRDTINQNLQRIIDEQTEPWGIKVTIVELKDVELPQTMQRAMAKQAEAEREKRSKIIHAEGEFQASKMLSEAAAIISREPVTLQLRYLQTLTEVAVEKNSTIVFPLPVDTIRHFMGGMGKNSASPSESTSDSASETTSSSPVGLRTPGHKGEDDISALTSMLFDVHVSCSSCGAQVSSKAVFCPQCGQKLSA